MRSWSRSFGYFTAVLAVALLSSAGTATSIEAGRLSTASFSPGAALPSRSGPAPPMLAPSAAPDTWWAMPGDAFPSGRSGHTAVWTGSEMIVWGGAGTSQRLGDGARYNPATGTWTALPTGGAPIPRVYHTAVWTGTQMVVWGGSGTGGPLSDGARYSPSTSSWTPLPTNGAPGARYFHTAVWTGSEMIIWGGYGGSTVLNDGARYNPAADTWAPIPAAGAPGPRQHHTAIWTGSEMIIWGGVDGSTMMNDGWRYSPATGAWTPVSSIGAPSPRRSHTAVWTGREMIIWGGVGPEGYLNTGGRYDPASNSWRPISATGAPAPRTEHTAVWTGHEMIIWAGSNLNDGGRYNPRTDTWTALPMEGAPSPRMQASVIWTGIEMITWGGYSGGKLNDGGRYTPPPPVLLAASPAWVAPGGSVTITWSGISNPSSTDVIGLYPVGGAEASRLDWIYVSCTKVASSPMATGSCTYSMPTAIGSYEFRLRSGGSSLLAISDPVDVPAATPTATPTATGTATPTATATSTPTSTPTATSTPSPTATGTAAPTPTATGTATAEPTATPTATATAPTASIRVQPLSASVERGAAITISLETTIPPGISVGAWTVDMTYDPSIVSGESCTTLSGTSGSCNIGMGSNGDRARATGATTSGLMGTQVLATFSFYGTGSMGSSSPLTLSILTFTDPTGAPLPATTSGGSIGISLVPTVTSVSPSGGRAGGGTEVTITGGNFASGATVSFGGVPATEVTVTSSTRINAKSPPLGLLGDVNGGGSVTALDALCILRRVAELPETTGCPSSALAVVVGVTVVNPGGRGATLPAAFTYNRADVDGDGGVTSVDALCVLRTVAGLPATLVCPSPG